MPHYYLCDLDNNGLEIYQRIKKKHFPNINLIIPDSPLFKNVKKDKKWTVNIDSSLYNEKALNLINRLIDKDKWIEEESIKLKI